MAQISQNAEVDLLKQIFQLREIVQSFYRRCLQVLSNECKHLIFYMNYPCIIVLFDSEASDRRLRRPIALTKGVRYPIQMMV